MRYDPLSGHEDRDGNGDTTMAQMTKAEAVETAQRLAAEWHEAGRPVFAARYESLYANGSYDTYYAKTVVERRKYVLIDQDSHGNGAYLINPTTGTLHAIEAYGRPGRLIGLAAKIDGASLNRYR